MKAIACSLALALSIVFAAGPARAIDLAGLARASLVAPETLLSHSDTLGLSPDQESKIKQIASEAGEKSRPLEAAIRERQDALEATLKDEVATIENAESSLQALIDAEASLKSQQLRTLLALRDTLTPEQRAKATNLAKKDAIARSPATERVKSKASRLKGAFDEIGIEPAPSLVEKGKSVESLVQAGDDAGAEKVLDELIAETGINEQVGDKPADFSGYEAGATDLDSLKQRIADVEQKARSLTKLPILRQLSKAREDLEAAKAASDADKVGRILTWAEGVLK